ncbi:MAG: 1-deoxy-D-xylulose-5-phosphate synthase [Muribaculaceae bacterium]|nr:1-deoxy-D-xylulose-5-phosphate synthase [Muribaculaceae bacterium]
MGNDKSPIINSPEELRALAPEKLPDVCAELRQTLIRHLASNPGHFASSMGAVDLTVALHYVFDTPRDRIVWDVGHQAYAHKLLTGRRDRFHTNRTFGGICGFPTPEESPYDTFAAGHASNSISAALGMSIASSLDSEQPRRHVVAVIGDASISGGLAFEGLNNVANTPNNLLIILNDNEMSIDHNTGALSRYLSGFNTSRRYNRMRYKSYMFLRRIGLLGDGSRGPLIRFGNSLKALFTRQQNIFEGLNIRYFGPIDGNDVKEVVKVLSDIKDLDGPKLLHLRTRKGLGFPAAEADPATWHAPGRFDPVTGIRQDSANGNPKWQDVFGETLLGLAGRDSRVVGITAAMSTGTSICMMQEAMPARTFDVGISEGHAVTFAAGLAKEGKKPFVAIYSAFLQRAYDQIVNDVALLRLPVTLCIDRAGIVGEDGATHHGAFDLAYLRTVPGMTIAAPSSADQLRSLMVSALNFDGPIAIRYPRGCVPDSPAQTEPAPMPVGKGYKMRSGAALTFLTIGPIAHTVAEATALLASRGIEAAHFDMVFLRPLDDDIMAQAVSSGAPIITVEDGIRDGGLGSAVTEWLSDHGHSEIPVTRLGLPTDHFVTHGSSSQLYKLCGLDVGSIADTAASILSK